MQQPLIKKTACTCGACLVLAASIGGADKGTIKLLQEVATILTAPSTDTGNTEAQIRHRNTTIPVVYVRKPLPRKPSMTQRPVVTSKST